MASALQRFEVLWRKQLTPTEPFFQCWHFLFWAAQFGKPIQSVVEACLLRFAVPGGKPLGGYDRSAPTGGPALLDLLVTPSECGCAGVKVQMADGEGSILEKSYSPISHPAQASRSKHDIV